MHVRTEISAHPGVFHGDPSSTDLDDDRQVGPAVRTDDAHVEGDATDPSRETPGTAPGSFRER